jgi:FeoC like transcriptional regulator
MKRPKLLQAGSRKDSRTVKQMLARWVKAGKVEVKPENYECTVDF